jgi:hypothetical protein
MMAGFIDVTNWSDQAVKRLGQRDDDDFSISQYNPRAMRKPNKPKYVVPTYNYDTDIVFAAAVQANQVNNGYYKTISVDGTITKTNRQLVDQYLADPVQIKQESRDKAVLVRKYFNALTFKILQGKHLSDFSKSSMEIASRNIITSNFEIAVICSLPASYEKSVKRDNIERRIYFATGGYLCKVGDKVSVDVEILKHFYSVKWDTNYVTGITSDDKVLFFAYNREVNIGDCVKIEGTVKAHRDNSTQLNRVKVIK